MSGFSAAWLALREPADLAARSRTLTAATGVALHGRRPVRAVDLATGTGSNVRFLSGYLPIEQEWLVVDHDEALLRTLPGRLPNVPLEVRHADLSGASLAAAVRGRDFVSASALLDLVSEAWMTAMADAVVRERAIALFVLSYDGRIELTPPDASDAPVREFVNRHQRIDKGFGVALGPACVDVAERMFAERGYRVRRETSDWTLGAGSAELQRQLIDGWAGAAIEIEPRASAEVSAWRRRRHEHVAAGRSAMVVGHADLLAVPQD